MRSVTVYMSDGDTITTSINGTNEEIVRHYLGNRFEAGCDTKHHVAMCIHFEDTGVRVCYGLRIKCIEHVGVSGCIGGIHRVHDIATQVQNGRSKIRSHKAMEATG